jgi:hypothetical protein
MLAHYAPLFPPKTPLLAKLGSIYPIMVDLGIRKRKCQDLFGAFFESGGIFGFTKTSPGLRYLFA